MSKYDRIKAMILALIMMASLSGCDKEEAVENDNKENTIYYNAGEHIISIPINEDVRHSNCQYEYHPGYEVVGISVSSYGYMDNTYAGGSILYVNTDEVLCTSNIVDDNGNYLYLNFGKPTNFVKTDDTNKPIKEFDIGEHIISVPIHNDARLDDYQYEYHDGYEVVGLALSSYGITDSNFGGGVLLYKNVKPVNCSLNDSGYTSFGIPLEKENSRLLTKY